jgi:chromosome segregation ATPase
MTTPVNPALIAAFKKLQQALETLEAKSAQAAIRHHSTLTAESARVSAHASEAEKRIAALESELQGLREEATHLKSENADLSRKLHALQQDHLELQQTAGSVVNRLDGSIRQLDMMLEH